jgi:hypothetical protein
MPMSAKCPRCEMVLSNINIAKIDAFETPGEKHHSALAYLCPHCETILGVVTDPDDAAGWVSKRS